MTELPKIWDEIFRKQGIVFTEPHAAMPGLVRLLKSMRARTVLDFGSGSGRHVIYLAKAGLSVFGLDNSLRGLQFTKEWLKREGLSANLLLGDMTEKLPYSDNFFDAIIAVQVIHHTRIAVIRFLIGEMWRIIKRGGVLFVTVPMSKNPKLTYEQIELDTYTPLNGREQGLPHHYFTPKKLYAEFNHFQIIGIHVDATRHYCLFGRK
jgi:SAM-dependent methyltransferase